MCPFFCCKFNQDENGAKEKPKAHAGSRNNNGSERKGHLLAAKPTVK
jgi:hypothetical protein